MWIGELAAVITALCWASGSILFTLAGRRVGSVAVNQIRLWFAVLLLIPLHALVLGSPFPVDAQWQRFFWLGLSGLVGYMAGDGMLFEAFVRIGPRMSMLLMTLVPVFSGLLGFIFLGERMHLLEIVAVAVTLGAIGWVVSERRRPEDRGMFEITPFGILMGVGGALGQATGLVLAKKGLEGGFSPISANMIRVSAAVIGLLIVMIAKRRLGFYVRKLRERVVVGQLMGAAALGPVLGVVLSLVAISHAKLGIASTLMSLAPLFLIPLAHFFFGEKVTWRAVIGTVVAIAGSALLFLI